MTLTRRVSLLAAAALAVALFGLLLATVQASPGAGPLAPTAAVTAVQFSTTALLDPVDIANTGVATDTRLFVVERDGRIKIVEANGTVVSTPFLDIDTQVHAEAYVEEGLLGLAFSPNYASDGHFFVYYTDNAGNLQLSRFSVSGDPNVALTAETFILNIPHPGAQNHNGGDLAFGPDGFLYAAPGDGGGGNDPGDDGQILSTLLGKVLRIDVTGVATYTIPASNPYTLTVGLDEIWAQGLRNPFRFSFDRLTGDLYIGDVGQGAWEEVNFQPADSTGGENYGWRCREGLHAGSNQTNCSGAGAYDSPVLEYCNEAQGLSCTDGGRAVIGGHVYRGSTYPGMYGVYFFADNSSSRFWAMLPNTWSFTELDINNVPNPAGFGEDVAGELYVASRIGGGNDHIYRLTGAVIYPIQTPSFLPIIRR